MKKQSNTLAEFIENLAFDKPDQVVSIFKNDINTYSIDDLNKKSTLLSKGLLYTGIEKGTPVCMALSGTYNCLAMAIALAKIGAILLPIDDKIENEKLSLILQKEKIHTLGFYAYTFFEKIKMIITDYQKNERGYLQSDKYPMLKNIVTFGSIKYRGVFTTRELMLLGMHIDDIEMETRTDIIEPTDIYIKQILIDKINSYSIKSITHNEIISEDFSLPAFQNILSNIT
jgi:fatty-acyl-CoA synthase